MVRVLLASFFFSIGLLGCILVGRRATRIDDFRIRIKPLYATVAWGLSYVTCVLFVTMQYMRSSHKSGFAALLLGVGVVVTETVALFGTSYTYDPPNAWKSIAEVTLFNISMLVTLLTISTCFLILLGSSKVVHKKRKRMNKLLEELRLEKARSDSLLLSIMPRHIAKRISEGERNINESHESVTIVFIDITNFTLISEGFSRSVILETLHLLFSEMDSIARRYEITKIKTIGDCWMGCCGVITPHEDHAERTVRFAMGVVHAIKYYNASVYRESETPYIQVRIGINSGRVISGVIGSDTFHFDIWGPSANLAERMQTLCPEPNAIQISESTYQELLKLQNQESSPPPPSPPSSQRTDHDGRASSSPVPRGDGPSSVGEQCEDDSSFSTTLFDSIPSSELHKLFTRRGIIEIRGNRPMHIYLCRVLTRQERLLDNKLATLQKNRLQAILQARRSFSYVATGMLEEEANMVRSRLVHFESF